MRKDFLYNDILDLPYPYPSQRKKISMEDRAVQFAPFAALNGYDDAIEKTAKILEEQVESNDSEYRFQENEDF